MLLESPGPPQGVPTAPREGLALFQTLSNELGSVILSPTLRTTIRKLERPLLAFLTSLAAETSSPTDSTPKKTPLHAAALPEPSPSTSNIDLQNPTSPPSPPELASHGQGGVVERMGGGRGAVAVQPAPSAPSNSTQSLLQPPVDLPPREGWEASSLAHGLDGVWHVVQKLTNTLDHVVERLNRPSVAVNANPFASLEADAEGPPPAPARTYATAARSAAPSTTPRTSPPRPAARSSRPAHEIVILRSATLPADHFLRAMPASRLLPAARGQLSQYLPPREVVAVERLERGDVRFIARTPDAAASLRRAIPLAFPPAEVVLVSETSSVALRGVPAAWEKGEVGKLAEDLCGEGEGAVKAARRVWVGEGYATWVVELWNTSAVSVLAVAPPVQVEAEGEKAWVSFERGWSRREAQARREGRGAYLERVRAAADPFPPLHSPKKPLSHSTPPPSTKTPAPQPDSPSRAAPPTTVYAPLAGGSLGGTEPASRSRSASVSSVSPSISLTPTEVELEANMSWDDATAAGVTGPGPLPFLEPPMPPLPKRSEMDEELHRLAEEGHSSIDAYTEAWNEAEQETLLESRDVVVVDLQGAEGASVRCVGVYNPCRGGSTPFNRTVHDILPTLLASAPPARPLVVAGDFNLRHPSWDPLYVGNPLDEAEEARLTFEEAGLVHLRPPGEPTWWGPRGAGETLDLALGNLQAEERLVSACIDESLECGSDHRPIRITLNISPSTASPPPPRRLHHKLDTEKALETYLEALEALPPPPALVTAAEVDLEADRLSAAATAPLARPRSTRFANAWWTPEVAAASGEARRLANRYPLSPRPPLPGEPMMRRPGTLREARAHNGHAREQPPNSSPADPDASTAPPTSPAASTCPVERLEWPELREEEVRSALFDARPFAAAGPDDVPNNVLQTLWESLRHRLVPLLAASLRLGHLPRSWRDATGVVLRKPKKPDYSNPKAYRLICFERCVAKLLEAVVARRLAYLADAAGLLPVEHVGGRKGRSAVDAVACFVDEIKRQWRAGNVCVGVALDVSQAFPSVRVERLVHELEEAGLPKSACEWVRSFMTERTCQLRFEGVRGEGIEWRSGLPQGSPLSPILFLLYNRRLIAASRTESSVAYGWIDDVNLLAWGKTVSKAVAAAQAVVPALEGWSEAYQSAFEPAKTFVTLFSPRSRRLPPDPLPPAVLGGVPLAYSPSLVMLGTTLDSRLTFREHIARCVEKASTAAAGVRLLAGAKAGLAPKYVRRLVEAVVMPRLLWMGEIWFDLRRKTVSKGLEGVQRSCCLAVTGAYRTTSLAALQVKANLPPLDLVLRRRCFALALRALSATPTHPLHARARLARVVRGKRTYPSPLHLALHAFPALLPPSLAVEPLVPHPVAPWSPPPRVSFVVVPTKEEAVEVHDRLVDALPADRVLAYTDGSLLEGSAGAALAAAAPVLASTPVRSLTLCLDNQSVVGAPFSPAPTPGQFLRLTLRARALELTSAYCDLQLTILWVPGHVGVEGNERVDSLAKSAASRTEPAPLAPLHRHARPARLFRVSQESGDSLASEWSKWLEGERSGMTRVEGEESSEEGGGWERWEGVEGAAEGEFALPKSLISPSQRTSPS
ncbi:hypothetical protein JCM10207_001484 [Rhodosporidiobolus poonsookiae]